MTFVLGAAIFGLFLALVFQCEAISRPAMEKEIVGNFTLTFVNFSNPRHVLSDGNTQCDSGFLGSHRCDPQFTVCFIKNETSWNSNSTASFETCDFGGPFVLGPYNDLGEIAFESLMVGDVRNPIVLNISRSWQGAEMRIRVNEMERSRFLGPNAALGPIMDDFSYFFNGLPAPSITRIRLRGLTAANTTLFLEGTIQCLKDFYDNRCSTYCVPSIQHKCDPETGSAMCNSGWEGDSCNAQVLSDNFTIHKLSSGFGDQIDEAVVYSLEEISAMEQVSNADGQGRTTNATPEPEVTNSTKMPTIDEATNAVTTETSTLTSPLNKTSSIVLSTELADTAAVSSSNEATTLRPSYSSMWPLTVSLVVGGLGVFASTLPPASSSSPRSETTEVIFNVTERISGTVSHIQPSNATENNTESTVIAVESLNGESSKVTRSEFPASMESTTSSSASFEATISDKNQKSVLLNDLLDDDIINSSLERPSTTEATVPLNFTVYDLEDEIASSKAHEKVTDSTTSSFVSIPLLSAGEVFKHSDTTPTSFENTREPTGLVSNSTRFSIDLMKLNMTTTENPSSNWTINVIFIGGSGQNLTADTQAENCTGICSTPMTPVVPEPTQLLLGLDAESHSVDNVGMSSNQNTLSLMPDQIQTDINQTIHIAPFPPQPENFTTQSDRLNELTFENASPSSTTVALITKLAMEELPISNFDQATDLSVTNTTTQEPDTIITRLPEFESTVKSFTDTIAFSVANHNLELAHTFQLEPGMTTLTKLADPIFIAQLNQSLYSIVSDVLLGQGNANLDNLTAFVELTGVSVNNSQFIPQVTFLVSVDGRPVLTAEDFVFVSEKAFNDVHINATLISERKSPLEQPVISGHPLLVFLIACLAITIVILIGVIIILARTPRNSRCRRASYLSDEDFMAHPPINFDSALFREGLTSEFVSEDEISSSTTDRNPDSGTPHLSLANGQRPPAKERCRGRIFNENTDPIPSRGCTTFLGC